MTTSLHRLLTHTTLKKAPTPETSAAEDAAVDILKLLLEHGADPSIPTNKP